MDFIRIAKINDFADKYIKSFLIFGKKIAVIRRLDNSFYGIEANCKHQGADLISGTINNMIATCPRHQWQYDLESGKCLNHESPVLRRYGVKIQGDDILISIQPLE